MFNKTMFPNDEGSLTYLAQIIKFDTNTFIYLSMTITIFDYITPSFSLFSDNKNTNKV